MSNDAEHMNEHLSWLWLNQDSRFNGFDAHLHSDSVMTTSRLIWPEILPTGGTWLRIVPLGDSVESAAGSS